MQHQTPQPQRGDPRLSDQCCDCSGKGTHHQHAGKAHHITPVAACLSPASATSPASPRLQGHISFICPDVTTHCRQCSKPSICSRGLLAGQGLPSCPSTHAPNQARFSLPSWGLCQYTHADHGCRGRVGWKVDPGMALAPFCADLCGGCNVYPQCKYHETWLCILLPRLIQHVALGKAFATSFFVPPCLSVLSN